MHVNVEFVDDAAQAHTRVAVHPGSGGANQVNWYTQSHPTTHAHELGHGMGLMDEYVDPRAFTRGGGNTSNVHTDDSLMGDYWQRGPGGNAIPDHAGNPTVRPGTEVKPRHWQQIQDDLDAAAAGGRPPAHGAARHPARGPTRRGQVSDPPAHQQILQETGSRSPRSSTACAPIADPIRSTASSPQAGPATRPAARHRRPRRRSTRSRPGNAEAKLDEQFPGLLRNINDLSRPKAEPEALDEGLRSAASRIAVANKVASNAANYESSSAGLLRNVIRPLGEPEAAEPTGVLNGLLDDISKGKKGAATELDRAAQRLREGHDVQLGPQTRGRRRRRSHRPRSDAAQGHHERADGRGRAQHGRRRQPARRQG